MGDMRRCPARRGGVFAPANRGDACRESFRYGFCDGSRDVLSDGLSAALSGGEPEGEPERERGDSDTSGDVVGRFLFEVAATATSAVATVDAPTGDAMNEGESPTVVEVVVVVVAVAVVVVVP